jgi:hypothetical protein
MADSLRGMCLWRRQSKDRFYRRHRPNPGSRQSLLEPKADNQAQRTPTMTSFRRISVMIGLTRIGETGPAGIGTGHTTHGPKLGQRYCPCTKGESRALSPSRRGKQQRLRQKERADTSRRRAEPREDVSSDSDSPAGICGRI